MTCPIAGYKIDENAARWVAGFVVVGVLVAVLGANFLRPWIIVFLAIDFGFRAFSRPKWSPLGRISGALLKSAGIPPKSVDAGPKRFAARIGLGFTAVLLLLGLVGSDLATRSVAGMLAACAFLEAAFGFCLGCRIYGLWYELRARLAGAPG